MAKARRSNNPLPANWREGIKPDSQERWKSEQQPVVPHPLEPVKSPSEKDQWMRQWMRQMHLKKDAQRRWGTGPVNRKVVEAEVRRRLLGEGW